MFAPNKHVVLIRVENWKKFSTSICTTVAHALPTDSTYLQTYQHSYNTYYSIEFRYICHFIFPHSILLFYTEIFYSSEFQNFLTQHKYINQYFDLHLKDFSNSLCTTVAHVLVIDSAYKKTDICTIATRV